MAKKKAAPKKKAAAKSEVNKSQAVRDYLKANRGAKPTAVSEAMKEQGIDVSPQAVSTIKFNMKKSGKKRGVGRRKAVARKSASDGEMISVSALLDTKKLVDKLGSVEKAKTALEALSKIS
jgi:hypothetical protein